MKNRSIALFVRVILKVVFIAAAIVLLISTIAGSGSVFDAIHPGAGVVFGVMGSAFCAMLVRKFVKISPPSFALFGIEIAAVVGGYILGTLIGGWLLSLFFSMGTIVGIIIAIVAIIAAVYAIAHTAYLVSLSGRLLLSDEQRAILQKNVNHGYIPAKYRTAEGHEQLKAILWREGIIINRLED